MLSLHHALRCSPFDRRHHEARRQHYDDNDVQRRPFQAAPQRTRTRTSTRTLNSAAAHSMQPSEQHEQPALPSPAMRRGFAPAAAPEIFKQEVDDNIAACASCVTRRSHLDSHSSIHHVTSINKPGSSQISSLTLSQYPQLQLPTLAGLEPPQ